MIEIGQPSALIQPKDRVAFIKIIRPEHLIKNNGKIMEELIRE